MSLRVTKDPGKRRGGWALIRLPEGTSGQSRVQLSRDDGALSLGPHGWQGSEHGFGSYPVEADAKGPRLRIGPEIVNQMEAYLTVEIVLPELALRDTLSWPDTVVPSLDAFEGGGVAAADDESSEKLRGRAATATPTPRPTSLDRSSTEGSGCAGEHPEPVAATAPQPAAVHAGSHADDARTDDAAVATEPPGERSGRSSLLWLLPMLVLLVAAGAAGWWWWQSTQTTLAVPPRDEPTAPPEPTTVACEADALRPILQEENVPTARLWSLVEVCRDAGERDLEVQLVGRLEDMESPGALQQFARWYDPRGDTDASPFQSDASNAAIYYKRARDAGVEEAAEDLEALCAMLRGDSNPLSATIIEIHCDE